MYVVYRPLTYTAGLSPVFLAASTTSMTSRISVQTQTAILLWAEATRRIVRDLLRIILFLKIIYSHYTSTQNLVHTTDTTSTMLNMDSSVTHDMLEESLVLHSSPQSLVTAIIIKAFSFLSSLA